MKEECGIFGMITFGVTSILVNIAMAIKLGLFELQHRGQESCGIATFDGEKLHCQTRLGLVMDSLTDQVLDQLPGYIGIGHTRYSTSGGGGIENAQPFAGTFRGENYTLCHNGNLWNVEAVRAVLSAKGVKFKRSSDTDVVIELINQSKKPTLVEAILESLTFIRGAYCFLFATKDSLIAVRDGRGIRPLVIGRLPKNNGYVFASETCAFKHSNAKYIGDVQNGEMVIANNQGLQRIRFVKKSMPSSPCVFELVYFSRPDSEIFGSAVHERRYNCGVQLAKEYKHIKANLVIGVPDSGLFAAMGFADESGIPLRFGLTRNHYVGRSFIQPTDAKRGEAVDLKLSVVRKLVKGKVVIVVDDSQVRSTTSSRIIAMLKKAGAKRIYFLLASPPIRYACFDGVDIPNQEKLIAVGRTYKEIAKIIKARRIGYLSLKGMLKACGESKKVKYCTGCINNVRPPELIQIAV